MANKIVLIGSTGFVGRNLKKLFLKSKIKCVYLSTKNFDLNSIKKNQIKKVVPEKSIIIYAAGKHRKYGDSVKLKNYNIKIFKNFLKKLDLTLPNKIIFLSTVEVYGNKNKLTITEGSKLRPLNLYARGKLLQENELKKFSLKNKIRFNILRLPGFYGKDDNNSIISKIYFTLRGIQKVKFITNGKELRDYVFINDLIKIINLFVKNQNKKFDGIYNIVHGQSYQIKSYFFMLRRLIKSSQKIIFGKKVGFDLRFNNKKLKIFLKSNSFKFTPHKHSIKRDYK